MIFQIRSIFILFLGMSLAIKTAYGMTLYELLLIPLLPFIFARFMTQELWRGRAFVLFSLFFIFIFTLIISGLMADDGLMITTKNVVRWLMVFPMAISFLYLHKKYKHFIVYLLVGYAIANLVIVISQLGFQIDDRIYWRNEIGESVSIALIAISGILGRKVLISICIFVVILNLLMDFRSMALVTLVFLLFLFYELLAGGWRRTLSILIGGVFLSGFFWAYNNFNQDDFENRRKLSNMARTDVTLSALNDLMSIKVLGNGYLHFFKTFRVESGDDSYFDMTENEMPIHGYLWNVSYEAGKFGFLFMLFLIGRIFIVIRKCINGESKDSTIKLFLALYFLYGNFMFAYAGFDRILVALMIGFSLAVNYSSIKLMNPIHILEKNPVKQKVAQV